MRSSPGHFECPFCTSHYVSRLYVASARVDSCECGSCGARWDEDNDNGELRGRARRTSVLVARPTGLG